MRLAIIKYNAGNIYSVVNALKRLGVEPLLTDDRDELTQADRIIFPGQGEASNCMAYLREKGLDEVIRSLKQPVLGICVGQQLMCRHSEEGDTDCLGIFDSDVRRFIPQKHDDKVPCMGWNSIDVRKGGIGCVSPLFRNLPSEPYVYFVHSYYVPLCNETTATSEYILPYSAAMQKDNFFSCQFHPEKSGKIGEIILKNFIEMKG